MTGPAQWQGCPGGSDRPQADLSLASPAVAILAWVHVALASVGLTAAVVVFAAVWVPKPPRVSLAFYYFAWPLLVPLASLAVPLAGGIGLLRRRHWARSLMVAQGFRIKRRAYG